MMRLARLLLVVGVWVAWSSSAGAVVIDVTYDLPAAEGNSTPFLSGQTPTGGTAKVRMDLTSISGSINTLISVRTIRFTHSTAGTVSFDKDPITNAIPQTGGIVAFTADPPPGWGFLGGELTTAAQASLVSIRAITTGLGAIRTLQGSEVNRKLVPEPASAALAGLGLVALGGYAARRRAMRRSSRS
jgi:hypothetical protein